MTIRMIIVAATMIGALGLSSAVGAKTCSDGFWAGTGAISRVSTNYSVTDTLGQFVVSESSSTNFTIEHGFLHSDIHIPTIPDLRQSPNYSHVDAYAKVVTAGNNQLYRTFYVAEQDRTGSLRVNVGTNPDIHVSPGDMVDVSGVIKGTDLDRYIDYPVVTVRFPNAVQLGPYCTSGRWLGGRGTDVGIPGGTGLLNTSLLMKTTGRVSYVDTASPKKFFYIDDGSGLSDGTIVGGQPIIGLRVTITSLATGNVIAPPSIGQYVTVTGICIPQSVTGKVLAQIRPRNQDDIGIIQE